MRREGLRLARSSGGLARRGFTLVEVLVGLALLAVLGGALSALQVGTLRANRNAQIRLQAAALLADELALQRVLVDTASAASGGTTSETTGACAILHMPDDWLCTVKKRCLPLPSLAPCAVRVFTVKLRPPIGEPLQAHGARFRWTEESP